MFEFWTRHHKWVEFAVGSRLIRVLLRVEDFLYGLGREVLIESLKLMRTPSDLVYDFQLQAIYPYN